MDFFGKTRRVVCVDQRRPNISKVRGQRAGIPHLGRYKAHMFSLDRFGGATWYIRMKIWRFTCSDGYGRIFRQIAE